MSDIKVINGETGEVIAELKEGDSFSYKTKEEKEKEIAKKKEQKEKSILYAKINNLRVFGDFYFYNYSKLLEDIDNDYALAFRFLYLCTYANYDGILVKGDKAKSKNYFKESDLIWALQMSPSMITKVKKELIANNLITFDNGVIKINTNYCNKGSIPEEYKMNCTRVFDVGMKDLYENSNINEHKRIGVVLPLLKYMNISNNVICFYPEEPNVVESEPLTIQDICKLTNYSRGSYKKLIETMLSAKVGDNTLVGVFKTGNQEIYIINPKIFYKGNVASYVDCVKDMFGIGASKW